MTTIPIRLVSTLREHIWGGRKLAKKYGKGNGEMIRIAESWESCEPLNDSNLLLKWIDTDLPTSVHVHPDASMSGKLGFPCENIEDLWIVVEADPESRVGIGFEKTVTREEILQALHERTLELLINTIEPKPGDCFVIPPGTIHYIDGGVTLLEATSRASVSLRLYDWLRDVTTRRNVQVAESLTALNYEAMPLNRTFLPGRNDAFSVWHGKNRIGLVWHEIAKKTRWNESNETRLITVLEGTCCGEQWEEVRTGETILIPDSGILLNPISEKSVLLETVITT